MKPKGFAANVSKMMSGTVIGQVIPILSAPFLSRIYSPDDFTIAQQFFQLFGILVLLSTLRYDQAIVLPKTEGKALQIFSLLIRISIVHFILATIIVWIISQSGYSTLGELDNYLMWLPITVFTGALFTALNSWHLRKKNFGIISLSRIGSSVFNNGSAILIGTLLPHSVIGMIVARMIGFTAGIAMQLTKGTRALKHIPAYRMARLKPVAAQYRDFPLINLPHAITDAFRETTLIFLGAHLFGDLRMGFYVFTIRILKIPLGAVGTAIGQVFLQRAAEVHAKGHPIDALSKGILKKLVLVSLPMFGAIAGLAPFLFAPVFGNEWKDAGILAAIISPWMAVHFIASTLSQIPIILGRQREVFLYSLISFALSLGSLWFGYEMQWDFQHTMMLLSFTQCIYFITVIVWMIRLTVKDARRRAET